MTRAKGGVLPLACALGVLLIAGTDACSSDGTAVTPASDAAPDAAGYPKRDGAGLEPDDGPYPSPFEGWSVFHEYDPACGFYVPASKDYLPPPIRWEPCLSYPETAGTSCRQMVLDWAPRKNVTELISPGTRAHRRADGSILLLTARHQADANYRILAPLDGPVVVALREQDPDRCVAGSVVSDGEHYAFRVYDSEVKGYASEYGGGAIGGRLDELRPKVLKHYHDSVTRSFVAGTPGLLEISGGALVSSRWQDGSVIKTIWTSSQDNGLAQNYAFFHGETLFWASDSYAFNKQKVYTEAGGVKDFLTFGDDWSKGAADLGTDGTDLVWIEASGRMASNVPFPSAAIVTAPFTTDPARALATRRVVRSDLTGSPFGTAPFVVGCGYAARFSSFSEGRTGTLLVRLSDGQAWSFIASLGADWAWGLPLALTCEELVLKVGQRVTHTEKIHHNVARVRLDSLGPGTPPP